jgi:hypothetical protein
MNEAMYDSGAELLLDGFSSATEIDSLPFPQGQAVVIASGILQGANATVVKPCGPGRYLVSVGEEKSQFWLRLPGDLLRVI